MDFICFRVQRIFLFVGMILFSSRCLDIAAETTGCTRPPPLPGVLQFIDDSNLELNDTNNEFFEVGTRITPVCMDPGQFKLSTYSGIRECQLWRQWGGGADPTCEPVSERIIINGDHSDMRVLQDSSISITLSSTTTFMEILCIVAEGSPKFTSQIDTNDPRVDEVTRRVNHATMGRPMAKGISLYPPLVTDSGTFGCRSVPKGVKEDHEVVITFQELSETWDCPNNITVSMEPGESFAHVYWTIPDFPDGSVSDREPGSKFNIGTTPVRYYSGNDYSVACEFEVTILDEENPVILSCPEDITHTVPPGQSAMDVSWPSPDAWDNSGVWSFKPDSTVTDGTFPIGQHDMIYEVSDGSGNKAYCNFTISISDDEPPIITDCPSNITVNVTNPIIEGVVVTWIEPNITDNSGNFSVNISAIPGETFGFGITLVTYVAIDSVGNEEYCDFFIIINDDVAPWFSNCPGDIIQYAGDMYGAVVNWDEPVAMDNAGIEEPITRSHLPGDYFQEGVHHVQNVARDKAGNEAVCEFTITITAASCPSMQTNTSKMVLYTWEETPTRRNAASVERCSVYTTNAGHPLATRECKLNNVTHDAVWMEPVTQWCGDSREQVAIVDLMLITVVESNVEEVAEVTADVTLNTTELQRNGIQSVADTLENIVDVQSDSIMVTEAVVKTVDNVLNGIDEDDLDDNDAAAASNIIRSLEKQVTCTTKSSEGNFQATEPRVAVRTVTLKSKEISRDITFVSFRDEVVQDEEGFLHINQIETVVDDVNPLRDVDTSIRLPREVKERVTGPSNNPDVDVHFSFILFQSDRLFKSKRLQNLRESNRNVSTSGRVISAAVDGPSVANLTEPVVIEFSPNQAWNQSSAECVYWDFNLEGGVGDWSSDGCTYVGIKDGRVVCHCNHLTSFAVLMDMSGSPSEGIAGFVLDFITQLGCMLSIAGLVLSLATLLALRSLRASRSRQILIQLCFSLLCLYVVFLGGIEATGNSTVCLIISALLHYFTLSTLAWMAVEARNMYLLLVRVFKGTESKFMLKACLFAWGTPTIIVTVCVALTVDEYCSPYHCFLAPGYPLYYGLMLPIGLILVHNFITFALVVKSLLPSNIMRARSNSTIDKKGGKSEQVMSRLQNALIMSVLLGLTWVFGFLAIDGATFIFQLLFCVCNSIQGLLVFCLFCLRSQDVRKAWKAYFPECNIHGQTYKVKENSYGYHLRGSDAHAWHGPMALGPDDGPGLEYYMYTNMDRSTSHSNGGDSNRYTYTSQYSTNSTGTRMSVFSGNSKQESC